MSSSQTTDKLLLEKMGRNLILFQRIEHALKGLIALGSISNSSISGVRPAPLQDKSLGLVAKDFVQSHLSSTSPEIPESDPADDEIILQSSFQIEGTAAQEIKDRIERAIPDRNRLAHSVIKEFDLSTEAGACDAITWLDESYAEHSRLLEILRDHHREVRASFQTIFSLLQSKQGMQKLFLPEIQQLPVVQLLFTKAPAPTSANAWGVVAEAVKDESRSEVQQALACFEMKSLSELMIASQLFELKAEETANGGTRMLYRLAPSAAPHQSNP